jgi:tetratricopeptide (TPR) repeat protein
MEMTLDVEVLDDQIGSIFNEIELAMQWKRPSILFAIYNSGEIRRIAQKSLEKSIVESGKTIIHYQVEYEQNLDLGKFIAGLSNKENAVFFIDPLNSEGKGSRIDNLICILNSCKGYLIDNLVKVVFWLTEKEALSVAHQAPDFWASRHRVYEFFDNQSVFLEDRPVIVVEPATFMVGPAATTSEIDSDELHGESAMVMDLSEGEDPSVSGINVLMMVGVSNWKEGNHEKAGESLRAALAIAERTKNRSYQAMCHKAIALVESDLGNHEAALSAYRRVIALGQENVTVWNSVGSLFHKTGRLEQALVAFRNSLKKEPNDPVSWHGLGNVYAGMGRLDEAVTCYRKAIQYNAAYMTPWVKLGDVLARQNRMQDALYAYTRTVEMDNKNVHAWLQIANIYFKSGSYDQAAEAFKKAIALGADTHELHNKLADALAFIGNYVESIPHFKSAIVNAVDDLEKVSLWNRLGDVHRRLNEYEDAVVAYETADKISITIRELDDEAMLEQAYQSEIASKPVVSGNEAPQLKPVADTSSQGSTVSETPAQSVAKVTSPVPAIVISPSPVAQPKVAVFSAPEPAGSGNAQLWVRLGNAYLGAGEKDRAIEAYQKAVSLDPFNSKIFVILAQDALEKQDYSNAVALFKKCAELAIDPGEKAVYLGYLGDVYRELKEYDRALAAFEEAILSDPGNKSILAAMARYQEDLDQFTRGMATNGNTYRFIASATQGLRQPLSGSTGGQSAPVGFDLNSAKVWNELGNSYSRFKSYDEAAAAYQRAIDINPAFGWAHSNLAVTFARMGNLEAAVAKHKKCIDFFITDADKRIALNRLGDAYRMVGNYSEAIIVYKHADKLIAASADGSESSPSGAVSLEQFVSMFVE